MRTGESAATQVPFAIGLRGTTGAARAIDVSTGGHLTFVGSGAGYQVLDATSQVVYEQQQSKNRRRTALVGSEETFQANQTTPCNALTRWQF